MNHPEQNMQELIPPPSPLNKQGWGGLIALLALVETVEFINTTLYAQEKLGTCPASKEYGKAFPALVEVVQEATNTISDACAMMLPQLEAALEQYNYARLQAIANCSKEDCKDREGARKELGWDGEKQVLL
jgi:hypothetical protein